MTYAIIRIIEDVDEDSNLSRPCFRLIQQYHSLETAILERSSFIEPDNYIIIQVW